jgi:hypothetical protein
MDTLTGRLNTRFLAVSVVPTVLLFGYVGFLIAAGAPKQSPEIGRAFNFVDGMSGRQLAALVIVVLCASIATHPLQVPMVQLLEGYWWKLPFGSIAAQAATARFRDELDRIRMTLNREVRTGDWVAAQAVADAEYRQQWLPTDEDELLPTALGNVLRAGESRAGERYGLNLVEVMPRLFPLLSPAMLNEVADRRNQLDAGVRLCVMSALATTASVMLLLPRGEWLFLPLATYIMCWTCYSSAVAAARGYSTALAAAVDLHHLDLYGALHLSRPQDLGIELERAPILNRLLRGEQLSRSEASSLHYPAKSGQTAP